MPNRLVSGCLAALCAAALANLAAAQSPPACAAPDPARILPVPAVCMREAAVSVGSPPAAAEALFAYSRAQIDAGRFAQAERALDCADAVIGPAGAPALRYDLTRRRAILHYRRDQIPQALARFECALKFSSAGEDRAAIARDLNNVGTTLRRIGDFKGALRNLLSSLEIRRRNGEVGGAVLINIADVYRDLQEHDQAMRYYGEALKAFRAVGERTEAAHTLESMAETELDRGQHRRAESHLREALEVYRQVGNRPYELRVYDSLARAALAQGNVAQAREWSASALAIAGAHQMPVRAAMRLQIARIERISGRPQAARAQLEAALSSSLEGEDAEIALLEELAAVQEEAGDPAAAKTLRLAHQKALARASQRYDTELAWVRTRFEAAERDRTIESLETENRLRSAALRQRTLWLWLVIATGLIGVLSFWLWWQRRRHLERIRQEARRVLHEEELARYRREADALAEDRQLLQTLLDSREDAVCLLDAEGTILAANRAANALLGAHDNQIAGRTFAESLVETDTPALLSALEQMEDSREQQLRVSVRDGSGLAVHLSRWTGGDGLIVLSLRALENAAESGGTVPAPAEAYADRPWSPDNPRPVPLAAVADASTPNPTDAATERSEPRPGDRTAPPSQHGDTEAVRDQFRRTLVALMLEAVDAWERSTGSSRLELAEKSRIWRVNIDDGRLRARAMERYLAVSKLPQNPRWRDVLRTAYFVLGHCDAMTATARADLQSKIDAVLAYTRREALV